MLSAILLLAGTGLMTTFVLMVNAGNQAGWSFLLPSIILLGLGGLVYDILHRKPRRTYEEGTERPLRRKKRRATSY